MSTCGNACRQLMYFARAGINFGPGRICARCGAGYRGDGYVYAIQAGGPDGPVKLGFSADPWRRRAELQTGSADKLCLRAVLGNSTPSDEARLHKSFAPPLRGEWFRVLDGEEAIRQMVSFGGEEVERWAA